jgi:hypothetical protein
VPDIAPIASWKRKMRAKSRDRMSFSESTAFDNSRPESPRSRVRKPRGRRALGQQSQKQNIETASFPDTTSEITNFVQFLP